MLSKELVAVPLDGLDEQASLALAEKLAGLVWGFKVNDLLLECGAAIVTKLKKYGRVFADAKLHDIPNTVANSVTRLSGAGADIITVHASGGVKMLERAVANAAGAKIAAVTLLTSLSAGESQRIFRRTPPETVREFAALAMEAGAPAIVCSAEELTLLNEDPALSALLKITPGIRPRWCEAKHDQERTKTPGEAVHTGAGLLVIGRPITRHRDPVEAVRLIDEELRNCSLIPA